MKNFMRNKSSYLLKATWLVALLAVNLSCEDFLDQKPQSALTTGNAYNNAADVEAALNGIYNSFMQGEYYHYINVMLEDVRSDNAYAGGGGDIPMVQMDNLQITADNPKVYELWRDLYAAIGRSNILLQKINGVNDPALEINDRRNQVRGEALFLRAFHYYQLAKVFGGLPLERNSNTADPSKTKISRATEAETYDFIIADLEEAAALLPDNYGTDPTVNKVRATKGAANALLAKAYAQRSDRNYTKVLEYCNKVISSPAGYALVNDYATLFDGNNYGSSESIMEIAYSDVSWDVSSWGVQLYLVPEEGWEKYGTPSRDLVNAYNAEGDVARKNATILFQNYAPSWQQEGAYVNWNPCADPNPAMAVPFNNKQKHPNGWKSGDNLYLLRLADIILLKAEAQNELNDVAGATTTLNQIRTRAGIATVSGLTQAQLRDKILNERRLELAFEAQRWDDLVRFGKATTVMNNLNEKRYTCIAGVPDAGTPIIYEGADYKWFLPIPTKEMSANPNLRQNPGYN
ncbi:MAG: RagB/SusD family nutrient uptake outer membrane protein [Cyclobacteriaceae bacterium]|nr:RagB/SusD family nutrient uptake outer membrane protein [Cyclobacteriaceae bacterium]